MDPNTGWITIKTELDRDDASIQDSGGVYAMYVKVKQIRLITWSMIIYFPKVCIQDINIGFLLHENTKYEMAYRLYVIIFKIT